MAERLFLVRSSELLLTPMSASPDTSHCAIIAALACRKPIDIGMAAHEIFDHRPKHVASVDMLGGYDHCRRSV